MSRDTVLHDALRLSTRERADVAAELLSSLDERPADSPEDVERAWAEEIDRRARRVLAHESTGSPWPEVRARLEKRLSQR
jgi:putative addiction module component (TIGR02574 family)